VNLLLEGALSDMPYVTDMRAVFGALPGLCVEHDWLISDLERIWIGKDYVPGTPDQRLASHPLLISGNELEELLSGHDIQFCWAVFSALPAGLTPEYEHEPFADGNQGFWIGSPQPQLTQAKMEIVCWDCSKTLLIGVDEDLARRFKARFPQAVDLDLYNRRGKPQ